jgi:hypothetical protein
MPATPSITLSRRKHLSPNKTQAGDGRCHSSKSQMASKGKNKRMNSAISSTDTNSLLNGNRRGAQLFTNLDCYNLNGNPRAEKDPDHASYIARLHKGSIINPTELLQRYKMLSAEDLDDNVQWRFATVIVPNNRERIDIIALTVVDFAKYTGQPVVRWMCNITSWDGAPEDPNIKREAMKDPCFCQYFVTGAYGICNENISVNLNITNGAPIKLYTLDFNTEQEAVEYETMRQSAQPGEFITLSAPPLSVNVIPWPDNTAEENKKYVPFSIGQTDITNQPVIPLTAQGYAKKPKPMAVYGGDGWYTSKATIVPQIPFDLAFSMTSFKAQGRTLDRVILSLAHRYGNCNNFSFHEFLVAISRVKSGDHIRIIPPYDNQYNMFNYLKQLRPNPEIMQLLKGLESGKWNAQAAWEARLLTEK